MSDDYIVFDEGAQYLDTHGQGLPATCYFLLSTKAINALLGSNTLAGGLNEITGTGYARQSQSAPAPVGPLVTFAEMEWNTLLATNWPNNVRTLILATTSDNTGKAICAWNIVQCLKPSSLAPPVSISASGGSGAAGVYYWQRTVVNAYGESVGVGYSAYIAAGGSITFNWAPVPGATGNTLYRAASSAGCFSSPAKVSGVGSPPFTDTMGATVAGACPTVNTTQGLCDMSVAGYTLLAAPILTLGD